MNRSKPWVKALDVSPHEFDEWTTQVEPQASVTFWALDKGKIKAQDYLLWAREHYQLPVLKDSYFKDYCNQTLWQQIQTVANWSPEMLPIEQWDGVVYVACVEPPDEVTWSFPVRYVLASARSLKSHYKRLTSGESYALPPKPAVEPVVVARSPIAPAIPEAPAAEPAPMLPDPPQAEPEIEMAAEDFDHISKINIPPPPSEERVEEPSEVSELRFQNTSEEAGEVSGLRFQTPVEEEHSEVSELRFQTEEPVETSLNFQSVEAESAHPAGEDSDSSSLHLPEDFKLDLKLNLENIGSSAQQPEALLQETASPKSDDVPEGLNLNLPPPPTSPRIVNFDMPEGIDLGTQGQPTTDEAPIGLSLNLDPASKPQPKPEVAAKEESPKFKLNFQVNTAKDEFDEPQPTTNTGTEGTVTRFAVTVTGLNKEAPKGAVIDTESLAPHTADDASSDTEAVAWLFNELKAHYQQSMILLFQGETLKPWKWESSWSPKSKSAFEGFQHNQPGLFRILYRTKHPYHGYVVDSPIHQKFFGDWGFEGFPHHVTALPVKVDGHLTAAVLCIGDESATSESTLVAAERLVTEFEQALKRLATKAA